MRRNESRSICAPKYSSSKKIKNLVPDPPIGILGPEVYLRIVSLVWGATGGVYIAGSIARTIAEDLRKKGFREEFENSDTMHEMLSSITIYLITINDLGLRGAAKCASFS